MQSVGGDQQHVAPGEINLLSLDSDFLLRAGRSGQDVAIGMDAELLLGQAETPADIVDPRIIAGNAR